MRSGEGFRERLMFKSLRVFVVLGCVEFEWVVDVVLSARYGREWYSIV
jgi:hypothetical protein